MKIGILDIGCEKISCFIASLQNNCKPEIIGIGHRSSQGIKPGIIADIELAQQAIISAIQTAENMSGETIDEFVVNFSSNTIRSHVVNLNISLDDNEINSEDIKNIYRKINNLNFGKDRVLLHKILTSYTVDNQRGVSNPIGIKGNQLIAGFNLITVSKNSIDNFVKCLSTCRIKISDIVATPYAAGLGCLTNDDFFIGSTVIDIGAGHTSIATFFDNKLIYADVFNLGGFNISSDIARGLSTPISEAERLKRLHGDCFEINEKDDEINVPSMGNENLTETHKVPKKVLNNIINARIQEILLIVQSKIGKSIIDKNFTNSIVLTGNTSQLKGLVNIASDIFGTKVRVGKPIGIKGLAENISGPGFSVSNGLIKFKMIEEKMDKISSDSMIKNNLIWRKFGTWIKESFF